MKRSPILMLVVIFFTLGIACSRSSDTPQDESSGTPPVLSHFNTSLEGRWVLTDTQSAGIGPAGVWSRALPAGRSMELKTNGVMDGGSVFTTVTGYQLIDSITIKLIDPAQAGRCQLFKYKIDTAARSLFFYILLPSGVHCTEGCGALKFTR